MVVDIHTHAFADKIAERAVTALAQCSGLTPCTDGTVTGIRSNMKKVGVNISVVQPVATKVSQVDIINDLYRKGLLSEEEYQQLVSKQQ